MLQGRLLIISSPQTTTALQFSWIYWWMEASRLQRNSEARPRCIQAATWNGCVDFYRATLQCGICRRRVYVCACVLYLRGWQMQVAWVKIGRFRQISCYNSKTVQDHFVRSFCNHLLWLWCYFNKCLILLCTVMITCKNLCIVIMYCMHEITAWKPRTTQPFLVAVLDFAVLACCRYGHAFCRRLNMSPFWLSPFWFVAVLTVNPWSHPRKIFDSNCTTSCLKL